ncbi:RsiV family protein [Brevundimonas sp.]|uniref:RsiV family protein n=1 Tax=Brevundimonas sp. TaxID=1871086 RepID=UPI002D63E984|nr:RsiV family protein [Brevundimonas sp.]HYD26770.1 RsiV family protein [Brevundimonas sp.]
MSRPLSLLLLTAVAVAALSACNRDRDPADAPAAGAQGSNAAITPADAAAPMGYEARTPYADVKLTLPEAIKPQTDLHARLYAEEVRKLRQFVDGAESDNIEAGADPDQPKFTNTVAITAAAETGKLFSLKRTSSETGGAQPNTLSSGLLWDKALKRQIGLLDLFRKGSDLTTLDQALCSALNTAKRARVPAGPSITFDSKPYACPRVASTPFVLTPGTAQGKAAGLTFLIGPFQAGSYAEGGYEIAIPATLFRSLLAIAYAGEFGGELVKAGDVTPAPTPQPAATAS